MGPGLTDESLELVALTERLRSLGVRRFEFRGAVVEIHDGAVLQAIAPVTEPLDPLDAERAREIAERRAREDQLAQELASA